LADSAWRVSTSSAMALVRDMKYRSIFFYHARSGQFGRTA
jgi:hypothetical protein